jgi:hypothetical protein
MKHSFKNNMRFKTLNFIYDTIYIEKPIKGINKKVLCLT